MIRADRRLLLGAVLTLAAAMLLLEVLAYRLSAAVLGPTFATLVGLLLPGAAALGAGLLARQPDQMEAVRLARSAAHYAAIAGGTTAAGAIAFTWVSQVVAHGEGDAAWYHGAIAVIGWLVPAFMSGGALALVF